MAKRIHALIDRKAEIAAEARSMLDVFEREDREPSDDELAALEAKTNEAKKLDRQIAAEQSVLELEAGVGNLIEVASPDGAIKPGSSEETLPFASLGEFLVAVYNAGVPDSTVDPRLKQIAAASGLSEGVPSDGGFLVQKNFSTELLRRTYELGDITSRVRRIPTTGNGLKINAIDESSRADGSRWGGVRAYWENEADLFTASRPKFRKMELDLKKLTGLCYATDELLQDAAALDAIIRQAFAEEFVFKLEDAIVNGTGSGQPLGILNAGCKVTVAKEGSQAAATVVLANIIKMWARGWARSRRNAVWLYNQDIEPQLLNMTGADSSPVFLNRDRTIVDAPPITIFGRPAVPVEYCATLGTEGDIILADFGQYLLTDKGAPQAATSIHVRFIYDETTFRFVYRADGQPTWNKALTPKNGSNTLSPFVTLATRA